MTSSFGPSDKRLLDVVKLYVRGYTYQDIAVELDIAYRTVTTYKEFINLWSDTNNRKDLVKWAEEKKIIKIVDLAESD